MSQQAKQPPTPMNEADYITRVAATGLVAMDIIGFKDYEHELQFMGLKCEVPSPACEADREIIEKECCGICGGALQFVPYSAVIGKNNFGRPSYENHSFGVCRKCDAAFEF